MIEPGQVVLFRFPHTDLQEGKMRPTLLVAKVPGRFDDWLACAISTQLQRQVPGAIGQISTERLRRIKMRLAKWLGE